MKLLFSLCQKSNFHLKNQEKIQFFSLLLLACPVPKQPSPAHCMEPFLEQTRFPPQNSPANNETTATNDDPTNDHLQQQQQQEPCVTDKRANEDANVTSDDDDDTAMTRMKAIKQDHADEDVDARWEEYKSRCMSKDTKKKRQPPRFDCAWCGVCEGECPGRPKHRSCSRCLIAYYCSRQCQRRHWG